MKRFLFIITLSLFTLGSFAQENITLFFLNDGSFKGFYDEEIDSIVYSHLDMDSIWHTNAVVQEIWMNDSSVRIPIESIDSICHKLPDPIYKPGVIHIDESYLSYIESVDGMTLTLSTDVPDKLRPHVGDVYYYDRTSDMFPSGLAGKVTAIDGDKVTFEQADIPDIYDKFVFFGRYVVTGNDNEGQPEHSLSRANSRDSKGGGGGGSRAWGDDDEDYGIDNWRMGDGGTSFTDTIYKAVKINFEKVHTALKAEISMCPVISIEYAYDAYAYNRMFYFKSTIQGDYELKVGATLSYSSEGPSKDLESHFWGDDQPIWKDLVLDYLFDWNDEEDAEYAYLVDICVPIPEFPLLQVGFKLGLFVKPAFEGELFAGLKNTGHIYKSFVYLDDETHDCDGHFYNPSYPSETEFFLEGSATASLWSGAVGELSVSLGATKKIGSFDETLRYRIGPYFEGSFKADIKDAIVNKSAYTLFKDTKLRTGIKQGVNLFFDVNFLGNTERWDQADWSPDELWFQQELYLYPEFKAPEYTTSGNTLTCSSVVSRETFPNNIGFALFDENGNEVDRKIQEKTYGGLSVTDEYIMKASFDNLDFANHRYTIVPTTRPFNKEFFQVDLPDEFCTTVLCPDSHHPHLIDLGLPSGTKWLCRNVLADSPEESGGYYQWGQPYRSYTYSGSTYYQPFIDKDNYQGTGYDAATNELGRDFATPTLAQFDELFENCESDYKQDAWGGTLFGAKEGVYLKGQNGANLYLPFAGYKEGSRTNSDKMGHYLMSDVRYTDEKAVNNGFQLYWNANRAYDADFYGLSIRPVSLSLTELSYNPQKLDFGELNVGEKGCKTVVATNTGNTPLTIQVSASRSPFSVDPESMGKFTLQPGDRHSIFVYFEPSESGDYKSVVNIKYQVDDSWTISSVPITGKGFSANTVTSISLDFSTINMKVGETVRLVATTWNGKGDLTGADVQWSSSDDNVAKVSSIGAVRAMGAGTCTITASVGEIKAECVVTVAESTSSGGYENGYEYVDLGLSVKWATCNIGASKPEDPGDYYAWGEIQTKSSYSWDNYKYSNYIYSSGSSHYNLTKYCSDSAYGNDAYTDDKTILDSSDDVAHMTWGGCWRMPTNDEFVELANADNCTWMDTTLNGVNGVVITSKIPGFEGNSIFLPLTGYYLGSKVFSKSYIARFWSSTLNVESPDHSHYLEFKTRYDNHYLYINYEDRYCGQSVRPVCPSEDYLKYRKIMSIEMSQNEVNLMVDDSIHLFAVPKNSMGDPIAADVKWSSSNKRVAKVLSTGTIVTVGVGTCIITASIGDLQSSCSVIVVPDNYEYVDLGLSVKWATRNVGARKTEEYGVYYMWGEIGPYSCYSDYTPNSKYKNKTILDLEDDVAHMKWGNEWRMPTIEEFNELRNTDNCTWSWTTQNGVKGYMVSSNKAGYEDCSIFLPAAGEMRDDRLRDLGSDCYYWSSTHDVKMEDFYALCLHNKQSSWNYCYHGMSVRPVCPNESWKGITSVVLDEKDLSISVGDSYKLNAVLYSDDIDYSSFGWNIPILWFSDDESVVTIDNDGTIHGIAKGTTTVTAICDGFTSSCTVSVFDGYIYVDLGLSVKWAILNIGAESPEAYGDYFAWGETEPYYEPGYSLFKSPVWKDGKSDGYTWLNYRYCKGSNITFTKYCDDSEYGYNGFTDNKTTLAPGDDVAHVKWGGDWRMPTQDEFNELIEKCTWTWTTKNGVKGWEVTCRNDSSRSIFLPAAGYCSGTYLSGVGSRGYYWSSSLYTGTPRYAWGLSFDSSDVGASSSSRYFGQSVRPVCP